MAKQAGHYRGRHFTEWVERVKQLKREGALEEAEALLWGLVTAAEEESRSEGWLALAPWYYSQLAIIYRKQKLYDKEIAILQRYLDAESLTREMRRESAHGEMVKPPGRHAEQMMKRLVKARSLAARQQRS